MRSKERKPRVRVVWAKPLSPAVVRQALKAVNQVNGVKDQKR